MKFAGILLALFPVFSAAQAPGCVAVSIVTHDVEAPGRLLYEIAFHNACAETRALYWCAEHSVARLPPEVACPGPQVSAVAPAPSSLLNRRRTFQWLLPAGARIRYHDCAASDRPTLGFGCAAAF